MADAKIYKEVVQDLSYELDKASKAMGDISRLQKGMIKGFTEITKTSTATGQAWTAVARFFSGTGFWKVQNKIKAVSNALQFMQKIEEKRNEQEEKRMKQLAENVSNLQLMEKIKKRLEKIDAGTADFEDYKSMMQNNMFRLYKEEHGMKMAMFMIQEKINSSLEKAQDYEKESGKIRTKNFTKRLREVEAINEKMSRGGLSPDTVTKMQDRLDELNASSLRVSLEQWEKINEAGQQQWMLIDDLNTEYQYLTQQITNMGSAPTLGSASQEEIDKWNEQMQELVDRQTEVVNQWATEHAEFQAKKGEKGEITSGAFAGEKGYQTDFFDSFKEGFSEGIDGLKSGIWEAMYRNPKLKKLMNLQEAVANTWGKVKGGLKFAFDPKNAKVMGKVAGLALQFMGKILMYFLVFIMFIVLLKAAGVFDIIGSIFDAVIENAGVLFEVIGEFITLLGEWFTLAIEFVTALFNGSTTEVLTIGAKLLFKTGEIVLKFWKIVLMIVIGLFWTLMEGIGEWINETFFKGKNLWQTGLKMLLYALGVGIGFIIASNLASSLDPIAKAGAIIAGAAAGMAVAAFASGIVGLERGGLTGRSGTYLVGERGPELINLPAGARVHNNSNTQHMSAGSNTINVNVNGRVGATDAELRDIASKIGRMVNMEMNRNTHRGVRGA